MFSKSNFLFICLSTSTNAAKKSNEFFFVYKPTVIKYNCDLPLANNINVNEALF